MKINDRDVSPTRNISHIFRVCTFNALQVTAMQTGLNHSQISEF